MIFSQPSKKLFLASSINSVLPKLANLAGLKPEKTKVAFVQNAAVPYGNPEELFWVKDDKQAFLKLDYQLENFDITNFTSKIELENSLKKFQIIHFCGGNTLYLNYLLHQTGLHQICQKMVNSGELIYIGTSAGSMVVGPDLFEIKDALVEEIKPDFLQGISRNDYFGLDLVPFLIIPYTNNPEFISSNIQTVQKLPNNHIHLFFSMIIRLFGSLIINLRL